MVEQGERNDTKMKSKAIIVILSVLLVFSLAANAIMIFRIYRELTRPSYVDGFNQEEAVYTEDLAPDFSVPLLTGENFTLSEHRGTVVVLDFWATWCGPCVRKMPAIQTLSEEFGDSVIFVGMNVGEELDDVQTFISERGFTYPIGLDEGGNIHRRLFPSPGIPYTVIIGADGTIFDAFLGGGDSIVALIEIAILEALG